MAKAKDAEKEETQSAPEEEKSPEEQAEEQAQADFDATVDGDTAMLDLATTPGIIGLRAYTAALRESRANEGLVRKLDEYLIGHA